MRHRNKGGPSRDSPNAVATSVAQVADTPSSPRFERPFHLQYAEVRRHMRLRVLVPLLICAACADGPEATVMSDKKPSRLDKPDLSFQLSATDRAQIGPSFDLDALQQLLQLVPPDQRASILKSFLPSPPSSQSRDESALGRRNSESIGDVTVLTRIGDPVLQDLLDKAWAPRWARYSLEELERIQTDLPGIEYARRLAKQRRRSEP